MTEKKTSTEAKKGICFLLLSAFLYSLLPVLIRTMGGGGLPPMTQVFLRYIFAFGAAAVYFFATAKTKLSIQKKDILFLLGATVIGYSLTNLLFTYAILYTQVGNALFLFYSYAIITPVLGFVLLKEKINKFNILSLILSFIALILLFQPNSFPTWKLGGFFAILSSLGQTTYLLLRKKLYKYPARIMMFLNTLIGVFIVGVLSLLFEHRFYFTGTITHVSFSTWVVTIIAGLLNFFAWFAMTKGFEYFKAAVGSIILLSELVFGITFAFLLFGEIPTLLTFTGGLLIVCASILVILKGES